MYVREDDIKGLASHGLSSGISGLYMTGLKEWYIKGDAISIQTPGLPRIISFTTSSTLSFEMSVKINAYEQWVSFKIHNRSGPGHDVALEHASLTWGKFYDGR